MDHIVIKATRSSDSEAFMRGLDPTGLDPADLKPDPPEPLDFLAIARKAQIEAAPRVAVSLDFFKLPPADDVDTDDGELDPPLKIEKIAPEIASALSDWRADFLKRTGFSEPTTTLGKKLGVVRQTIREVDGERQLRGFNDKNELVDFRILLPDTE